MNKKNHIKTIQKGQKHFIRICIKEVTQRPGHSIGSMTSILSIMQQQQAISLVYNESTYQAERYDSQGSHHHRQKVQSSPFVNPFFGSVLSDQRQGSTLVFFQHHTTVQYFEGTVVGTLICIKNLLLLQLQFWLLSAERRHIEAQAIY